MLLVRLPLEAYQGQKRKKIRRNDKKRNEILKGKPTPQLTDLTPGDGAGGKGEVSHPSLRTIKN